MFLRGAKVGYTLWHLLISITGGMSFPNNSPIIISVSHFECITTDTHNTFYNPQLLFLEFRD